MGLLAAAGFITGEALLGIGLAVPGRDQAGRERGRAVRRQVRATSRYPPSIVFVAIALFLLYKLALRPAPKARN